MSEGILDGVRLISISPKCASSLGEDSSESERSRSLSTGYGGVGSFAGGLGVGPLIEDVGRMSV